MYKERYFTESSDRTHTLLIQVKTKSGKWVDYEKCYSQQGFGPKDYITHYYTTKIRLSIIDENEVFERNNVRVLNGMRKEVFSGPAADINILFGGWQCDGSCGYTNHRPFAKYCGRPFAYDAKIVSIRFKDSELADILVTDLETEDGWNKFVKILQDLSFNNDGFKSFTPVALTEDDNNLHWYKVKCNSGLQFSFALYA